jgi:hypothetical protein
MRASFLSIPVLLAAALSAGAQTLHQPEFRLGNFHAPLRIDNWLSPMQPGTRTVFQELEDGECTVNDVVVSDTAKQDFHGDYAGLSARPVLDKVWADPQCDGKRGPLLEDTTDWYAQDDGGNVWYIGERTIEYFFDDAGHPAGSSTEGSWEAGRNGARAGIVMLARPVPGLYYRQEYSRGVAEDAARVEKVGIRVSTSLGYFTDCIKTRETTAITPDDLEYKYYCPNIGLVRVLSPTVHGGAELVNFGLH